jgi:hypothetical protein
LKTKILNLALCLLLFSAVFAHVFAVLGLDVDEAEKAVEMAEAKVLKCYEAAVRAEKAGANITALIRVLNDAGMILSEAKLAYGKGHFELALKYASECSSMLEGFEENAENMRLKAETNRQRDFMVNYLFSGLGALAIIIGGLAVWILLSRREKAGKEERAC